MRTTRTKGLVASLFLAASLVLAGGPLVTNATAGDQLEWWEGCCIKCSGWGLHHWVSWVHTRSGCWNSNFCATRGLGTVHRQIAPWYDQNQCWW